MVEIIGFIISLLALLYIFIRQTLPSQRPTPQPRAQHQELIEDDPFKDFMKAVEKEVAKREVSQHVPPPPKIKKQKPKKPPDIPLEKYQLKSQLKERHLKSTLEERHIKSKLGHHDEVLKPSLPGRHHHAEEKENLKPSRAKLAIQRLNKRQDLIIYQEIISKPKALRSNTPFP